MTQVLLLHIPPSSLKLLSELDIAIAFIQDSLDDKQSLVDIARKSLDEKLTQDVHPRSLDPEFCKRMYSPVGVDEKGTPFSLDICPIVEDDELQKLSDLIHYLANDADVLPPSVSQQGDEFFYHGVEGTVCEGCIYANGIREGAEGCGRLFKDTFGNNYLSGRCLHKKKSLDEPSEMERQAIAEYKAKKKEKEDKPKF